MNKTIKSILGAFALLFVLLVPAAAQRYSVVLTAAEAYAADMNQVHPSVFPMYYNAQLTNSDVVWDSERGEYVYTNAGEGAAFVSTKNYRESFFLGGIYLYVLNTSGNVTLAIAISNPWDFRTVEQIIEDATREWNGGPPPVEN